MKTKRGFNFMQTRELDETSLKILSILQKNSRESFSEIGRKVGLSAPAVAERIKKMEETGVIKNYTIEISHEKLGLEMLAFMLVNLPGSFSVQVEKTENVIADIPEVLECHRITGRDDMVVKVVFKDIPHMKKVIDSIAPFGQINTCMVVTSFRNQPFLDMKKYMINLKQEKIQESKQ
jgi:Lrp/AsnC family transcriptional regulator, leucine-responsive regulatory protein